eukprot:scpid96465/ scgid2298/ 
MSSHQWPDVWNTPAVQEVLPTIIRKVDGSSLRVDCKAAMLISTEMKSTLFSLDGQQVKHNEKLMDCLQTQGVHSFKILLGILKAKLPQGQAYIYEDLLQAGKSHLGDSVENWPTSDTSGRIAQFSPEHTSSPANCDGYARCRKHSTSPSHRSGVHSSQQIRSESQLDSDPSTPQHRHTAPAMSESSNLYARGGVGTAPIPFGPNFKYCERPDSSQIQQQQQQQR